MSDATAPPSVRPEAGVWWRRLDRVGWGKRACAVLAVLAIVSMFDAFVVEPRWLRIAHHELAVRVPRAILVAHLSDLHTKGLGRLERALLDAIDAAHPDVIVVTGDVVDDGDLERARPVFERLHAPRGTWVVSGNWEIWRPTSPEEGRFYASVGARWLRNEAARLDEGVWIVGLDDPYAGFPDARRALAEVPSGVFRLAIFHAPIAFDALAPSIDVAFAGHTHGGQVRLPWIGALVRPPGSGAYDEGWYARGDARMHVSRGLGTSLLPVRFYCRPELALIRLAPR
jgi:predicted MPP superfamily phosphohydrolase